MLNKDSVTVAYDACDKWVFQAGNGLGNYFALQFPNPQFVAYVMFLNHNINASEAERGKRVSWAKNRGAARYIR